MLWRLGSGPLPLLVWRALVLADPRLLLPWDALAVLELLAEPRPLLPWEDCATEAKGESAKLAMHSIRINEIFMSGFVLGWGCGFAATDYLS